MGRRFHNRGAVERFITFYDNIFPASAGSTFNLEAFDSKPESRPPLPDSDRVWDFVEDPHNQRTGRLLVPIWRRMKEEQQPFFHIVGLVAGWSKPLQLEETDHAALKRWRAKETLADEYRADLFERAISWAEEQLEGEHPGIRIEFRIPRKDQPVNSPREHYNRMRTWGKEDAFRLIGPEVQRVLEEEDVSGIQAAKALVSQRTNKALGTPCSFWRIEEAWLFWKREQEEERESA